MKLMLSVFVGTLLMALSSQMAANEPYPAKIKEMFIQNCSETNQEFCRCTINEIERRVSFGVFMEDLRAHKSQLVSVNPYRDAGLSCASQYQSAKNDAN